MNTITTSSEAIRAVFTQPRDMVSMVDDLLTVCREHHLELDWSAECCRVRAEAEDWREVRDLPLRKAAFRGILARLSALCNERHPNSCTPYGGQGEIAVGTTVLKVVFTNTPADQRLQLAVQRPAGAPIAGTLTPLSPMTGALMNEPLTFEAGGHPMLTALAANASRLRDPLLWGWTEGWLLPALDAFHEDATEGEVADALNHLAQQLRRRADVDPWMLPIAELRAVEYAGPPHSMTAAIKLKPSIELPANRTKNRFTLEQARQLREALRRLCRCRNQSPLKSQVPMIIVHDITDYQIHFFAIPHDREPDKRRALCAFLNSCVDSFAEAVGKKARYPIQLDIFRPRVSDRLAIVEPARLPSGIELELDVRTLHDAVFLRARSLREGPLRLEQVKAHRSVMPLPQSDTDLPNYVGALRVLYVESDEQDGGKRAEIGEQLANDGDFPWLAEAEPIVTELGAMLFGAPRPIPNAEAPVLDLIFVGGRDTAAQAEHAKYPRHPFLVTLPELALCHLKVRNSAEDLDATWLPKVADCDRELRDLFPRRGQRIATLEQMRSRNDDITTRQADLVDALVHVRAQRRTIRTNRDNFISASSEAFPALARRLRQSLIDAWVHGTELQAENDVEYAEGTLQRAENHFKSIEATAAVCQAHELTMINRWQIILAVVGVLVGLAALILAAQPPAPSSPSGPALPRAIGASTKSP